MVSKLLPWFCAVCVCRWGSVGYYFSWFVCPLSMLSMLV